MVCRQRLGLWVLFSGEQPDLVAPCVLLVFPQRWRLRVKHCCPTDTYRAVGRSLGEARKGMAGVLNYIEKSCPYIPS